jgi:phosphatidylserine decarboxylase
VTAPHAGPGGAAVPLSERLAVAAQHLLPKQALTSMAGAFARWQGGALTTSVIRWFIGRYGVNMAEAADADPAAYASFNDFFTRALKPGARPLVPADLVSPVDGAISQLGAIAGDQLLQAKGHSYSTTALVGGDAALAAHFHGGQFATIYLSPRDYHRIHMPCAGRLLRMVHVPGELFSVNPATARGVPGLFARNERVVCVFESEDGGPGCWCWWAPPSWAAWPRCGTAWSTRRAPAG